MAYSIANQTENPEVNDAFVLRPGGEFYYEQRPVPTAVTGRDVLIRVVATGICGSDVHYWQHGRVGPYEVTQPIVLGHESSGIVVATGPEVGSGLAVGDRVALEPGSSCNVCSYCRAGRYNLCASMRFAATPPHDGTLATFYTLPEECCFRLPAALSFEEGALMEPLSVAVHCSKLAGLAPGLSVLVFGAGPIGLLVCAVARAFGAAAVAVADINEPRLAFAREYAGVETVLIQPGQTDLAAKVVAQMGLADGFDVVIEATGVQSCIGEGVSALKRGGTFVQAGLGASQVHFPIGLVCDKEVNFKGSFRYGPGDYALAIDLVRRGSVSVAELITHRYSFSEAEKAFQGVARREGIKTMIYGPGVQAADASSRL
ncbi:putative D-xylulose reductase A [Lasiodiplodia hormozganensis]|uniref:D-xylulose reductase A n=1 Tax=Lasiodiplodia hormozganensis TaxID=869390 RepID=A0AA40CYE4_9PEZI|nr:putative D-xylulose reductase A [Lasiodiplodia hormozganensis]